MILELKNINGGYLKGQDVIHNISFSISANETIAVLGQNGAGKSTLAKAIIGLTPYCKGDILYKGEIISRKNTLQIIHAGIAYYTQGGAIFPHLTVYENLSFAAHDLPFNAFKQKKEELEEHIRFLKTCDLKKEAGYLSGGERHLLALAMVLMKSPELLILDEPSAGLSPILMDEMYNTLNQIKKVYPLSILLIEQNVSRAIEFSERLFLLKSGIIEKEIESGNSSAIEVSKLFFQIS